MNNSAIDLHSSKASLSQSRAQRRLPISSLVASMGVLASVGVLAFLLFGEHIKKLLEGGVYKLTYQFLLLGGVVSLLYKEFSDERNRDQERRILLRKMHSELLDVFNSAKLVHRTLRARIGYPPLQDQLIGQ
jgi:hypothetical protein